MNIYLVRHGQSEGNIDPTIYTHTADHAIPLSDLGREQAKEAGQINANKGKQNIKSLVHS